ncbi:hypothetical protein Sliba_09070 [Streptomyces nigrescens]|uniref:Transposase IS701-like DDE domain-containing protein n=1 Tax=Streptomyces nigrescens TaxID=1920 RepID=A0A640TBA3_STRNI|nr:hypothetical protein Sliba_09070 [Streptomyces libani subsp. libani]GGV87067.1 hypothetical protein GCM10010500_06510 [Streptomyces libani subsp. libani]
MYLPTSWTDDRERCRQAGIDDTVGFETKVVIAKKMVRRAIADKIPFRRPATAEVGTPIVRERRPWAAGLRLGACRSPSLAPQDRRHRVVARRSVSRPEEISYYIAYCPAGATLDELIHIAGIRWAVEACLQTAKQECGLDDYQVRRYPGWHPGHGCPPFSDRQSESSHARAGIARSARPGRSGPDAGQPSARPTGISLLRPGCGARPDAAGAGGSDAGWGDVGE